MARRRIRTGAITGVAALLGLAALAVGCRAPLFPEREPRTQYDRYDAVRNQQEPTYVIDEFGRRRPNIRGRVGPK